MILVIHFLTIIFLWTTLTCLQQLQLTAAWLGTPYDLSVSKRGRSRFSNLYMSVNDDGIPFKVMSNVDPQKAISSLYNINVNKIRYLGKGSDAIVREGCVLLPPTDEYQHFLMRTALWVYAMGWDDDNQEQLIRCVGLDNPTPFTMAEMMMQDNNNNDDIATSIQSSVLLQNLIYRGGNTGGDVAMMFHSVSELERTEIGHSGMYEGGLEAAIRYVETKQKDDESYIFQSSEGCVPIRPVERFKFFFNYCQFSPDEIESMLASNVDDNTDDAWISLEVPPEVILAEWDKNECWKYLRNRMKQQNYIR
jgi:Uncharacterized ACR, COG1678